MQVSNGSLKTAGEVIGRMRDIYPEDAKFKVAFEDKELRTTNSRNKNIVRYILFSIERHRSKQDLDKGSAVYTLEHILPENPADGWGHIEEAKQERLIYRLGNMTLLEAGKNRDSGNQAYAIKRKSYLESALRTTKAVAENYEAWDESAVESRQKQLAKAASGIWKINFR